jgi:hypothetical protein
VGSNPTFSSYLTCNIETCKCILWFILKEYLLKLCCILFILVLYSYIILVLGVDKKYDCGNMYFMLFKPLSCHKYYKFKVRVRAYSSVG